MIPVPKKSYNFLHTSTYPRNAKFYADFKSVKKIGKKCSLENFLAVNFSKLVIEKIKRANSKLLKKIFYFFIINFFAFFSTV